MARSRQFEPSALARGFLVPPGGGATPPPPRACAVADGGDPDPAGWSDAVREWLRSVYGPCVDTLLDLISHRRSYEEAARELKMERWQLWRLVRSILAEIRWMWIAHLALDTLSREDGFTLDCRTGQLVRPGRGFAVSVRGANARLHNPTVEATGAYLHKHRRKLLCKVPPLYYFGGWLNSGDVYEYDLSLILPDIREATAVAVAQGQRAVYDFARRRNLPVPGQENREAA